LASPPPAPTSPLFPYTTLFRSADRRLKPLREPLDEFSSMGQLGRTRHFRVARLRPPEADIIGDRGREHDGVLGHQGHPRAQSSGDRKSTRLNSSHLVISYAVFC